MLGWTLRRSSLRRISNWKRGIEVRKHLSFSDENFSITKTDARQCEKYVDFMLKHFVPREKISRGTGVLATDPTRRNIFVARMKIWAVSPVSCFATHLSSSEIAGVSGCQIVTRDSNFSFQEDDFQDSSQNVRDMQRVLSHLQNAVNPFDDPTVHRVLELGALAVDEAYSGNKLPAALMEKSEALGRENGCDVAIGLFTNVITQRLGHATGYSSLHSLDFEKFDIEGKKMDLSAMEGTTIAKVMVKDLRG